MKRFSRSVQVEGCVIVEDVYVELNVGIILVNRRPFIELLAEAVAHSILG